MNRESLLNGIINLAAPLFTAVVLNPKGTKVEISSTQQSEYQGEPQKLPDGRIYIPDMCTASCRIGGNLRTPGTLFHIEDESTSYLEAKASIWAPKKTELELGIETNIGETKATATLTRRSYGEVLKGMVLFDADPPMKKRK